MVVVATSVINFELSRDLCDLGINVERKPRTSVFLTATKTAFLSFFTRVVDCMVVSYKIHNIPYFFSAEYIYIYIYPRLNLVVKTSYLQKIIKIILRDSKQFHENFIKKKIESVFDLYFVHHP